MQPTEFWPLPVQHFWWEFDYHVRQYKALKTRKDGTNELDWEKAWAEHKRKQDERKRRTQS